MTVEGGPKTGRGLHSSAHACTHTTDKGLRGSRRQNPVAGWAVSSIATGVVLPSRRAPASPKFQTTGIAVDQQISAGLAGRFTIDQALLLGLTRDSRLAAAPATTARHGRRAAAGGRLAGGHGQQRPAGSGTGGPQPPRGGPDGLQAKRAIRLLPAAGHDDQCLRRRPRRLPGDQHERPHRQARGAGTLVRLAAVLVSAAATRGRHAARRRPAYGPCSRCIRSRVG